MGDSKRTKSIILFSDDVIPSIQCRSNRTKYRLPASMGARVYGCMLMYMCEICIRDDDVCLRIDCILSCIHDVDARRKACIVLAFDDADAISNTIIIITSTIQALLECAFHSHVCVQQQCSTTFSYPHNIKVDDRLCSPDYMYNNQIAQSM